LVSSSVTGILKLNIRECPGYSGLVGVVLLGLLLLLLLVFVPMLVLLVVIKST
jgi:hypothetical protein